MREDNGLDWDGSYEYKRGWLVWDIFKRIIKLSGLIVYILCCEE